MVCEPNLTAPAGLMIAGFCPDDAATIVLIAPEGAAFWRRFTRSAEYADGRPHPMDRWSRRIIGAWAGRLDAQAIFPSDGPPYPQFFAWALASGRCWSSPVGMLVHDEAGLLISFRGALRVPGGLLPLPAAATSPCEACPQPCRDACPAGAFDDRYITARCHDFLDQPQGRDCMTGGCRVRRACPISLGCGRLRQQSEWHMRQFHP